MQALRKGVLAVGQPDGEAIRMRCLRQSRAHSQGIHGPTRKRTGADVCGKGSSQSSQLTALFRTHTRGKPASTGWACRVLGHKCEQGPGGRACFGSVHAGARHRSNASFHCFQLRQGSTGATCSCPLWYSPGKRRGCCRLGPRSAFAARAPAPQASQLLVPCDVGAFGPFYSCTFRH